MKPLILWARDKHPEPYTLRVGERSSSSITGQVKINGEWLPFSYNRKQQVVTVGDGVDRRLIHINEWGWEQ